MRMWYEVDVGVEKWGKVCGSEMGQGEVGVGKVLISKNTNVSGEV